MRRQCNVCSEVSEPKLVISIITIFIILSSMQIAHAFTSNNIDPARLHLSDAQRSIAPHGANIGRIILYSVVIVIVIVTRLKWTKYGRRVTKPKIMIESIFFLVLGSIVLFDSFYDVGIPILYLIPYLILFLGLAYYSYLHSNRLMSFWKESKSSSIYVKGGTHIHLAYMIGTISRIIISVLFIGSLFSPNRRGIIYVDNSTTVLATIVFDLLLMLSLGLLIGINRRILIRYKLIKEGKEMPLEK
ncbi:MAG: hypothetical protein JO297_03450 [Nitrososphaeraceae archaeon]|nr:hypothetical protein [Nitrososphaeraceae archaeon]